MENFPGKPLWITAINRNREIPDTKKGSYPRKWEKGGGELVSGLPQELPGTADRILQVLCFNTSTLKLIFLVSKLYSGTALKRSSKRRHVLYFCA